MLLLHQKSLEKIDMLYRLIYSTLLPISTLQLLLWLVFFLSLLSHPIHRTFHAIRVRTN